MTRRGSQRLVAATLLLAALPARAHTAYFSFTAPREVVVAQDGGMMLKWLDADPLGTLSGQFYVTGRTLSFFEEPNPDAGADLPILPTPVVLAEPDNSYFFDTSGLAPGCYQLYALLEEPFEPTQYSVGPARFVVPGADDTSPGIFITNPATDVLAPDGTFTATVRVEDPEDGMSVVLQVVSELGDTTLTTSPLPLDAGAHLREIALDLETAPRGSYQVIAQVDAANGRSCAVYWDGILFVPGGPYTRADAGPAVPDAGSADRGRTEQGFDGGTGGMGAADAGVTPAPRGGCHAVPGTLWLALFPLAFAAAARRRR